NRVFFTIHFISAAFFLFFTLVECLPVAEKTISKNQRQVRTFTTTTEWPFDNPENFKPLHQEHQNANEPTVGDLFQGFRSFLQLNKDGTTNVGQTVRSIFDGVFSVVDSLTKENFF
uniref:Uncharacterized protein n=1 Tax=Romanomermis culicivorax TaxID=13658 RepID=A0A915HXJ2_ROMCU